MDNYITTMLAKKDSLITQRHSLVSYLNMKVTTQDWHGVADAAMDLRDIDSELLGVEFGIQVAKEELPWPTSK